MILYLSLAIVASSLMALGLLMMKSRSTDLPMATGANAIGAIVAWLRDPMWFGGLCVQTAGWACYVIAVSHAPVSMVAVMMQGGIALFVIASVVILGERASPREWIGMAVARLNASGASAAILSGVAFGLGAMFTKSMTLEFSGGAMASELRIVTNPYIYCMLAANIFGMVMLQNSFHSARAIIAMPLSGALSNIVPIIGGMLVFGERLPAGTIEAGMRVLAFLLTVTAGALLAGSRAQSPGDAVVARAAAGG
jgi:uncharacterized membrane protein